MKEVIFSFDDGAGILEIEKVKNNYYLSTDCYTGYSHNIRLGKKSAQDLIKHLQEFVEEME